LVLKQFKEGPEYLECFVVIDQISTLIACRTSVKDGGCCAGVDQNFDLRISHLNLENVSMTGFISLFPPSSSFLNSSWMPLVESNVVIKYTLDGQKGTQEIVLRLPDPSVLSKLKVAHATLHQNGPEPVLLPILWVPPPL
jgi:hypothetical protein